MEINQGSASFVRDRFERAIKGLATVATGGAEDVANQAMRVHSNQHPGIALLNVSFYQCQMRVSAIYFALVSHNSKVAVTRVHERFADTMDVTLMLHPVADQLRDGENFQIVIFAKFNEVGHACHGAVLAHDFAD